MNDKRNRMSALPAAPAAVAMVAAVMAAARIALAAPYPAPGDAGESALPIRIEKISPRVIVLRAGDNPSPPNVTALATEKGIVVIDTYIAPSITREMRKVIEKEFGRDDFAYVINTHNHFDHSNGNMVFPEALVVGHENSPAAFRRFQEGLEEFIRARKARLDGLAREKTLLDPASPEASLLAERLELESRVIEDLQGDFITVPPTVTFSDRMNLELGDILLHLIYFGKGHTDNDILIHCPQEKLLLTGDALGSLIVHPGEEGEVALWLQRLEETERARGSIEHVVTGHGRMNPEDLTVYRDRVARIHELVQGKTSAVGYLEELEGKSGVEAALADFRRIRAEGPGSSYYFEPVQFIDLSARWIQSGKTRAGAEFYRLTVTEFGDFMKSHAYLESWFTDSGERLLEAGLDSEAVLIFRANVTAYPESIRSWAGLGEALLRQGDKPGAREALEQALRLDPDNRELARRLEKIKSPRS